MIGAVFDEIYKNPLVPKAKPAGVKPAKVKWDPLVTRGSEKGITVEGTFYPWKLDRLPTRQEVEQVQRYHNENRAEIVKPSQSLPAETRYGGPIKTKGLDEYGRQGLAEEAAQAQRDQTALRGRSVQDQKNLQAQAKAAFKKKYGFDPDKEPARAAQVFSQETVGVFENLVSPVTRPVGNAVAAINPYYQVAEKIGLVKPGTGGDLLTGVAAGSLNAPIDVASDLTVLTHPNSSLRDRAGAVANMGVTAIMSAPAQTLKAGIKGYKGIAKGIKSATGAGAEAFEEALQAAKGGGIPSRSIADAPKASFADPEIGGVTFRPKEGFEEFVARNWKTRTEGLINALTQEIEKAGTSSLQRKKKAQMSSLRSQLRNSLQGDAPHGTIQSELRNMWNEANKPSVPSKPVIAEPEPPKPAIPPKARPQEPKPTQSAKPTESLKPYEGPKPDEQGVTHSDVDILREEMGWQPREKKPKADVELVKEAKRHAGKEETIAQNVLDNRKRTLTDDESLALGNRLRQLRQEMTAARAANNADAFILADDAAQKIANALDESGTRQGRAFRARQFVAVADDAWALRRRLDKKLETGEIPKESAAKVEEQIKAVEDQETLVQTLRTGDVEEIVKTEKSRGTRMTREELDQELEDIFAEFKSEVGKLKTQANDLFTVTGTLTVETSKLVGRVALNLGKRGALRAEELAEQTIKAFKARGLDITREDVFEGISRATESTPRTKTDAQKAYEALKREAKKIGDEQRGVTEAKRLAKIQVEMAKLDEVLKSGNLPAKAPKTAKAQSARLEIEEAKLKAQRQAVRTALENAGLTKGQKAGRILSGLSTELKLWNPVARAVDVVSSAQEVVASAVSSAVERPIANLASKLLKEDVKWNAVPLKDRVTMLDRWKTEVKKMFQEAKHSDVSRYGASGPATKFAGMLDTPGRAFHFLGYAGERAAAIAKKTGKSFEDILDQIRNPEKTGPITQREALDIHNAAKDFADINMLTNANWSSRAKSAANQVINQSVPDALKPVAHFINDITFQFGRVLVNVADKTGQYSNPYYGTARAIFELMGTSGSKVAKETRIRQFSQIVRRGGVGAGMVYLGKAYYESGERIPEVAGVPMGSTIVRVMDKKGKKTGSVYQDDGYLSMLGGFSAAFMTGYRQAQIEDNKQLTDEQRGKMSRDLLFAPLTDNPIMGNTTRFVRAFELGKAGDTVWEILTGMYYPGGLREWASIQDKQEKVYGRRAEGPVEIFQKRVPYVKSKLQPKGRPEVKG